MLTEEEKIKIKEEESYRAGVRAQFEPKRRINRLTGALLAIFLGWIGIHKFYLGRSGQGILYLLFFWTGIPAILGLIEGITYLTMSDQAFEDKYSGKSKGGIGCLVALAILILPPILFLIIYSAFSNKSSNGGSGNRLSPEQIQKIDH